MDYATSDLGAIAAEIGRPLDYCRQKPTAPSGRPAPLPNSL